MKTLIPKITLFLLLGYAVSAVGQSVPLDRFDTVSAASNYEQAIIQAREEIQVLIDGGAPGVSIAVGIDDQLVWAEGYGYADVEFKAPVSTLTKFRIGSVSKSMTSIAMALLYEQGVIDLDVPIQTYLSEFPVKEKGPVTLRLLASHRAGVRHYLPDGSDNFITKHYNNVVDALEIFEDDPLLSVPGDEYSYSSHGYELLAATLQEASGEEFLGMMRARVFSPLKLIETVADHTDYIIENRAKPYTRAAGGRLRNAPYVDNSYKWASGGFISTPSDLVKFGFGVFNSGLIRDETLQLLLAPPLLPNGTIADQTYGLGWVDFNGDGSWFGHTGGSVGGNTLFMVHPEQNVVVAVVCNLSGYLGANRNLRDIGELFLE